MKNIFLTLSLILLGVVNCCAQEAYVKTNIGLMSPLRRTFFGVEVGKVIAPRYSIGLSCEMSGTESNVSPKIIYSRNRLMLDAGFGWAHRWQKNGCNDHNYHTYTIGAYWSFPIRGRTSFYFGCSALWRSYQSHIGLHKGSLKLCAGMTIDIRLKKRIK